MSQSAGNLPNAASKSKSLPAWVATGVIGLVLGGGITYLAAERFRPPNTIPTTAATTETSAPAIASGSSPAGMTGGSPPGSAAGAAHGAGGGSAPGMGGAGGMGGGMGAGGGKRALTSLVGKLELLSRPNLKLHIELDAEQAKVIAAKLAEFEKSETMSAEVAQEHLDAIEAVLTPDQKTVLAEVNVPSGRGGRGGGGGGAAAAAPGGGMMGMMGMMGGGNPNENPFTQEANQKRLRDLLSRLSPAAE